MGCNGKYNILQRILEAKTTVLRETNVSHPYYLQRLRQWSIATTTTKRNGGKIVVIYFMKKM